jgi:CheY-like chemotaxis protein
VLLADDDATSLTVARRMLEGMGCQVDVAGNGVEATRLAVATHYDVIFMDCHMPELDGCAATQSIRADSRNQSTPVIALTASALLADRENCLRTGMNDHVSKPVHKEVLRETLLRWAPPRSELHDA